MVVVIAVVIGIFVVPAMLGGNGIDTGARAAIYCVIPRDLAAELHEPLRDFFRSDDQVRVVVERRRTERRTSPRRQAAQATEEERRLVRSATGRRVVDRRARNGTAKPLPLPPEAGHHADRLVFIERREPSSRQAQDAASARLVIRAQQGDQAAVTELYLLHYDGLYNYLRLLLKDAHEAEDILQDVFIQVLRVLPRYEIRREQPFRILLYRIAKNRSLDHFRKTSRTAVEGPAEMQRLREAARGTSEQELLEHLSDSDLAVLLRRLPETQLHVLLLRYMLDFTPEEVAAVVKTSPGAARTLQYRALKQLRGVLQADEPV